MLFVLDIAASLHLLCFNSFCTLNPANWLQYQQTCMYVLNTIVKSYKRYDFLFSRCPQDVCCSDDVRLHYMS